MSAAELRDAAKLMRLHADECGDKPTDFIPMVAKLLDDTAETWEMCDQDDDFRLAAYTIAVSYTRHHALAVARTYLGDPS